MRQTSYLKVPKRIQSVFAAVTILAQLFYLVGPAIPVGVARAQEVETAPTLTTDKADYFPGDTVHVTGANFDTNTTYGVTVTAGQPGEEDYYHSNVNVFTDAAGGFVYTFQLDEIFRPLYLVKATDADGNIVAETSFTDASIGSYNQCSNDDGDGYATGDQGCRWVNGNIQSNNSTYFEGDSTVQKLWIDGFVPGSAHTVTLQYGTTKGGKHAYDFLTTWDHSENWAVEADLCQDVTGCATADASENAFPIPSDPNGSGQFEFSPRNFTMRGAAMTGATVPVIESGSYAADSETIITLSFTVAASAGNPMCTTKQGVTTCGMVLWFGAHIAKTAEWFPFNGTEGATSITGSPYHVALSQLDGASVGQRDNQMQAGAIAVVDNPLVTTNIHLGSNHTTDVQGTTVAIGSTIHDQATVSNVDGANGTPTGTVTFDYFTNGSCQGTPANTSSALALVNGAVDATGFAQGPLPTGSYSFLAHYASSDTALWSDADGTCETVSVGQGTSTVATTLHNAEHGVVTVGSAVPFGTVMHDLATVTPSSSFAPTGSVTFRFYGTQAACAADTNFSGGTTMGTVALVGGVAHPSDATTALTPGDYAFKANWPGDVNYTGNTSTCENFTVNQGTSSISTTLHKADETVVADGGHVPLGTIMHDSATVTPASTIAPTGNVTFTLYPSNNCTGQGTAMGSVALDGSNPGVAHPSDSTAALAAGNYSFQATWAGDSNYTGNISSCEPFVVDKAQLEVSTLVHDAAHVDKTNGNVPLGSVMHDTATLTGAVDGFAVPTPSFTLTSNYVDSCAAGAAVVNDGMEGDAYKSADSAALGAGEYAYRSVVAENSNYLGDTGECEPFTVDKGQLTVETIIHDAQHAVVAEGSGVPLGSVMHDTAMVTGTVDGFTAPTPTFTMTTDYDDSCDAGAVVANDGTDVSGWDKSADSAALAAGSYAYRGAVAGNDNYEGDVSACEPFIVNQAQSQITTDIHNAAEEIVLTVPLGTTVHDLATVTGIGVPGLEPTGLVGFAFYPNNTCTVNTGSAAGIAVLDGNDPGTAHPSASEGPLGAGLYSFRAQYGGDSNYIGGLGPCEPLTVEQGTSSLTTTLHDADHVVVLEAGSVALGTVMHDLATVSVTPTFAAPTGNVDFRFYSTVAACTEDTDFTGGVTKGSIALDGATPGVAEPSEDTGALGPGAYAFKAMWAGDDDYTGSTGTCETFTVTQGTSTVATELHMSNQDHTVIAVGDSVEAGTVMHDSATVTVTPGFAAPTGNVEFRFYSTQLACGEDTALESGTLSVVALDGNNPGVAHPSADTAALAAGNYAFKANWAGDANYAGNTSDCENFYVVDGSISLTPQEASNKIGDNHEITAHVTQNDGTGTTNVDGALVTFTVTSGSATFVGDVNTCTTDATGTCSVWIVSGTTGNNVIDATTTFSVGGVSITRDTIVNSGPDGSDAAEKLYVNARISITPAEATNRIGDAHTMVVTVEEDTGSGWTAVEGAVVNALTSPVPDSLNKADCLAGTDVNGQCDVIINSSTTGTFTTYARSTILVSGVEFKLQTDGSGDNSGPAVKDYVNARITIDPLTATNEVGDQHEFTVTVEQDMGAGFVPVAEGTLANAIVSPAPTNFDASDCTDGVDALGQCVVTINSTSAGVFTIYARSTVIVDGVTFKLQTNGVGENSGPAVKTYVDLLIAIDQNSTNAVNNAHTFTVTVRQNDGSGWTAAVGATVTPGITGTGSLTGTGTCETGTTDVNGQCTIIVNSPTTGVGTISATTTVTVGGVSMTRSLGDGLSGDGEEATKTWVNARIGITPADDTNPVNAAHTMTVTVDQDLGDGNGFVPVEGAIVNAITSPAPDSLDVTDCNAGTDVNGQCDVIINSSTPGVFTTYARSTISVDGVQFKLQTNGSGDNSGPAVKTYVDVTVTTVIHAAGDEVTNYDLNNGGSNLPLGSQVHDNATVTPSSGTIDPAATVTYSWFANSSCEGTPVSTETVVIGTESTNTAALAPGDYSYSAHFDGSYPYPAKTAACERLHIDQGTSTTVTELHEDADHAVIALGGESVTGNVHDQATVTGDPVFAVPTGDVTFRFYATQVLCRADEDFTGGVTKGTVALNGSGVAHPSDATGALAAGNYAFRAQYAGDANYTGSMSDCENFTITTLTINKLANGSNDTFGYTVTGPTSSTPSITTTGTPGTGTTGAMVVTVGDYTVGETTIPSGWVLVSLQCAGGQVEQGPTSSSFAVPAGTNVTCNFENTKNGATRTQGFWQTHTALANEVWTNDVPDLLTDVNNWSINGCTTSKVIDADAGIGANELMGGFWSNIAKTTTGIKRTQLDQARMQLLQQLLAAMLNRYGLETDDGGTIAAGMTAFCTGNVSQVKSAIGPLGSFNSSGDDVPLNFPNQAATAQLSKSQANLSFWNNPVGN